MNIEKMRLVKMKSLPHNDNINFQLNKSSKYISIGQLYFDMRSLDSLKLI